MDDIYELSNRPYMKNRITTLFSKKPKNILSVYYTAGFPELDSTVSIAQYLANAGADIIEIGIPFSDPVADGPTIQQSNKIALENGMNVSLALEQVRKIREAGVDIPIIFMGYLNPVFQYGMAKFLKDASNAGVDGLILPDMPLHEYEEEYQPMFEAENLCNTFLISPTTSQERIKKIDAATNGFVYAVSASSITGARETFTDDQLRYFERLQKMKLDNPCLLGFGISNHETFSKGAVVGSAFINLLKASRNVEKDVQSFVKALKGSAVSNPA
jgi:tryptophan synthase alpha chain